MKDKMLVSLLILLSSFSSILSQTITEPDFFEAHAGANPNFSTLKLGVKKSMLNRGTLGAEFTRLVRDRGRDYSNTSFGVCYDMRFALIPRYSKGHKCWFLSGKLIYRYHVQPDFIEYHLGEWYVTAGRYFFIWPRTGLRIELGPGAEFWRNSNYIGNGRGGFWIDSKRMEYSFTVFHRFISK